MTTERNAQPWKDTEASFRRGDSDGVGWVGSGEADFAPDGTELRLRSVVMTMEGNAQQCHGTEATFSNDDDGQSRIPFLNDDDGQSRICLFDKKNNASESTVAAD